MHEIYELKEMLCKELEEYGSKGELSAGTLDIVDKLAHTIKNLDKILESDGYSGDYNYAYERGGSYARGRGGNTRRDSMGRYSRRYAYEDGYSRADDMIDQLRELMGDAPDEKTKHEIQKLVTKLEQM